MPATSIKLGADLVKKVTALKPKGASISAYVRELIEREHRSKSNREPAGRYQQFLDENPEERGAAEVWEAASLDETDSRKA
jgi:hypothetical protein